MVEYNNNFKTEYEIFLTTESTVIWKVHISIYYAKGMCLKIKKVIYENILQ